MKHNQETQEKSIFEEVQERYSIIDVAEDLGINLHRVGRTYRAWSIANDGTGENAFTAYHHSNTWYDFKLEIGGDITDLVAFMKYDGDKKQALRELLPDYTPIIDRYFHQRKSFEERTAFLIETLNSEKRTPFVQIAWDYLISRGITPDYIKATKIGYSHNSGGRLFIPYLDINGKNIVYFITRRLPNDNGEENEKEAKYMKASLQDYPFLQNKPWGLHTLNRGRDELFITEGQFDAMHLDQAGASVLAPNGKTFGDNWNEVINHAKDFKHVILAFDNDKDGQEAQFNAAKLLLKHHIPFFCADFLGKDIAEFFQHGGRFDTLLNSTHDGRIWIARKFTEGKRFEALSVKEKNELMQEFKDTMCEIGLSSDSSDIVQILYNVEHFFPKDWLKEVKKNAVKGPDEMELAERVIERYGIKYDDRTGAYKYRKDGCWEHITDNEVKNFVIRVIGKKCTAYRMAAVARVVKSIAQAHDLITKLDRQPVFSMRNGTLHFNYNDGSVELMPHSALDFVTTQAKYSYIPNAKSKIFLKALNEIFDGNEDSITTLQEFFGYVFLNDCRYHTALVQLGVGGNGKSVITEVLSALVGGLNDEGRGLVSHTMLSKFSKDFRLMNLKNSWVNISSETDIRVDGAEANFKLITAGETVEDSYKGKDPVNFVPRTKLIVNCNEFPLFRDKSRGLTRRLLFLDFPVNFVKNPREGCNEKQLDPNLVERITSNQQEMAGILNWALDGLKRILQNKGFTITASQKKVMNKFDRFNDPTLCFMEDNADFLFNSEGEGEDIQRTTLYAKFKEWLIEMGEQLKSARAFYHALENIMRAKGSTLETHQVHGLGVFIRLGKKPLDLGYFDSDKAA